MRQGVYIPNPELSETEDLAEVDDEISEHKEEVNILDELFEGISEPDENDSCDSDYSDSVKDSSETNTEDSNSETEARKDTGKIQPKKQGKKDIKWRKKSPAKVDSQFKGPGFPDPPDDLVPKDYFSMFFDHDLIALLVEQTNLYSVQTCGKNVQTNNCEIEQFLGILILMGIIKYPSYRMYWAQDTRIQTIADAMSINRFESLN